MTDPDLQAKLVDVVCRALAEDQAARWGYTKTLDQQELAAFIRTQAEDHNLRADVTLVWRHVGQMAEELRRRLVEHEKVGAAYLVVDPFGGKPWAGIDQDRAHELARNTGCLVVELCQRSPTTAAKRSGGPI
jgi:hypothetical protein